MITLNKELSLLRTVRNLFEDEVQRVTTFIEDKGNVALAKAYDACLQKRQVNLGFNLFAIISDLYYRETFHSDILKALLDPKSPHGAGDKYLRLFLAFLKSKENGATIDPNAYPDAEVTREEGRVDVLVKDEDSKKAVIIENKIKDAIDQPKQLPRYLYRLKSLGFSCDAIVYLRLNREQQPDMTGWTPEEIAEIKSKLICVTAYNDAEDDLLNGWIQKCENVSRNPDAESILRQYGALIKKLGGNVMNKPIMKKFYSMMLEGENLKTAQSLKAMLDELVLYRAERILDHFKHEPRPFQTPWIYKGKEGTAAVFDELLWHKSDLAVDIYVEPECYRFQVFDRNFEGKGKNPAKNPAKVMLQKMTCLDEYKPASDRFERVFRFPSEEEKLFEHIRAFKKRLGQVIEAD